MKFEIANEFGVNLGADTTSRANGSVGVEITKRLVQMAEQQMGGIPISKQVLTKDNFIVYAKKPPFIRGLSYKEHTILHLI